MLSYIQGWYLCSKIASWNYLISVEWPQVVQCVCVDGMTCGCSEQIKSDYIEMENRILYREKDERLERIGMGAEVLGWSGT